MPEGHPHCQNARTNTTIIRYLIADNRAFGRIHDKPDIGFDTTDFDVCFIGSKYIASFVIVVVYEKVLCRQRRFYNSWQLAGVRC